MTKPGTPSARNDGSAGKPGAPPRAGYDARRTSISARERMQEYGANTLTDAELLTIIAGRNGRRAADALLSEYGPVQALASENVDDLSRLNGVTPRAAAAISAAVELGRRTLTRTRSRGARMGGPRESAAYLLPRHGAYPIEKFGIVSLNARHRTIRTTILSVGDLQQTPVNPALVFRTAATHRAAAIVMFHNHPSGDPTPSEEDIALTARMTDAGALMGIQVLDHIVLAGTLYYSFKEHGRL